MTEQELRQELGEAIKSAGIPEGQTAFDLKQRILVATKSYADARESKVIAELKADNKRWCSDFYKIKFELETAEAEIKRLRESLLWLKVNRTPDRAMIEAFIDKAISPAPVTEGTKSTYTIQHAKDVFAARYDRTWDDILHQFEIGSGMSKLMGMEQVMEYVAEIYKNEDKE